jgi:hypothetical protein
MKKEPTPTPMISALVIIIAVFDITFNLYYL